MVKGYTSSKITNNTAIQLQYSKLPVLHRRSTEYYYTADYTREYSTDQIQWQAEYITMKEYLTALLTCLFLDICIVLRYLHCAYPLLFLWEMYKQIDNLVLSFPLSKGSLGTQSDSIQSLLTISDCEGIPPINMGNGNLQFSIRLGAPQRHFVALLMISSDSCRSQDYMQLNALVCTAALPR